MGKPVKKVSGREGHFRSADQTDNHDADVGDADTTTGSADDRREGEDAEKAAKDRTELNVDSPFSKCAPEDATPASPPRSVGFSIRAAAQMMNARVDLPLGERVSAVAADKVNAAVTSAEAAPSSSVLVTAVPAAEAVREARATEPVLENAPALTATSPVSDGAATTTMGSRQVRHNKRRPTRLIFPDVGQLESAEVIKHGKDASAVGRLWGNVWAPGAVKKDLRNGSSDEVTERDAGAKAAGADLLTGVAASNNLPNDERKTSPLMCIPGCEGSVSETPSKIAKVASGVLSNAAQLAQLAAVRRELVAQLSQNSGYRENAMFQPPPTSVQSSWPQLFKLNEAMGQLLREMAMNTTPMPALLRMALISLQRRLEEIHRSMPHISPTEFIPLMQVIIEVQLWLRLQRQLQA